jgi:hypothetical protein
LIIVAHVIITIIIISSSSNCIALMLANRNNDFPTVAHLATQFGLCLDHSTQAWMRGLEPVRPAFSYATNTKSGILFCRSAIMNWDEKFTLHAKYHPV